MIPLKELRTSLDFHPHEINFMLYILNDRLKKGENNIDFDVYLESKGFNLQRGDVWTLEQKQELIWSILKRRNIPRISVVYTVDDTYKVIDGKQRLSSMLGYLNNEFPLSYNNVDYYFKDLPKEHQSHIEHYGIPAMIYNEFPDTKLSDQQLIDWFMFINFAGTPQDVEHFEKLKG